MNKIKNIKSRISVRSYRQENIETKLLKEIKTIINKKRVGPFGTNISFILINTKDQKLADIGKMTSYGVIKGASLYMGGSCDPDDNSIIDYGYCFEELILDITELNIGTCWLGGTFGRSFVSKAINLKEGKVIPAISPIGIKHENLSFTDKLVRKFAKSDQRKPNNELFFNYSSIDGIVPINFENENSSILTIFEMLRIGPSASNKQPWRIILENKILHLYWDKDLKYNGMIKTHNIQALDIGIALCHILQTSSDLHLDTDIKYKDPEFKKVQWNYVTSIIIKE